MEQISNLEQKKHMLQAMQLQSRLRKHQIMDIMIERYLVAILFNPVCPPDVNKDNQSRVEDKGGYNWHHALVQELNPTE